MAGVEIFWVRQKAPRQRNHRKLNASPGWRLRNEWRKMRNVIINFASRLERNKICFISLSVGAEIVVVHWCNFQFHLNCENIQKFPTKWVMKRTIRRWLPPRVNVLIYNLLYLFVLKHLRVALLMAKYLSNSRESHFVIIKGDNKRLFTQAESEKWRRACDLESDAISRTVMPTVRR